MNINRISINSISDWIFEKKKKFKKCNHDINDKENTTLIKSNKRTMVVPGKIDTYCTNCQKTFSFILENGKYVKV